MICHSRRETPTRRHGFTLVELLVVILILAILIALLVPAIAAAVRSANNARVTAEFSNLSTALADFRSKYGDYPPSRIILHNNGSYNLNDSTALPNPPSSGSSGDLTYGDLNARTVRAMRKYFPRAGQYFGTSGQGQGFYWGFNAAGNGFYDLASGDAGYTNAVILQGHECLVFFLGGIPKVAGGSGGTIYGATGFGRDPLHPFYSDTIATNRSQPLFDFSAGRLQDIYNFPAPNGGVPNGFPSYIDPLSNSTSPRPYAYFSAYGGNNYDPNDDNSAGNGNLVGGTPSSESVEVDDAYSTNPLYRLFYVNFPVVPASSGATHAAVSAAPNPYTNTDPTNTKGGWLNPQTFQLISAGGDGQWGLGGGYEPNSTGNRLPAYASDPSNYTSRIRERDNLTNFANGRLD